MAEKMESGLKVLVYGCDISHDTLPVWPLCVHHLIYILEERKRQLRREKTAKLKTSVPLKHTVFSR